MTEKEFKEAMHTIAGRTDAEQYNKTAKVKKNSGSAGTGILCAVIAVIAVAAVTFGISLGRINGRKTPSNADGPVLIEPEQKDNPDTQPTERPVNDPTAATEPTGAQKTTPVPKTTAVPVVVKTPEAPATPEMSGKLTGPDWFREASLNMKPLSYASLDRSVNTLNPSDFGAELIPALVMGDHEDCPGVYYNPMKDELICMYHEFLAAAGITVPEGQYLEFKPDRVRSGLTAVRIYNTDSVRTTDLWLFDRASGSAARVALPEGAASYDDVNVYSNALWNGKLCLSVNTPEDRHYVYVYDVDSGSTERVLFTLDGPPVAGSFIADNKMILSADVYSFYDVVSGVRMNVVGEYNYFAGGKVHSVKNNGWANHKEVEVAAYDAATGLKLDNEPVLVRTVLDDGTRVFLVKNSTTGEETVIIRNYVNSCCVWSRDYNYFYAFSASEQRIACYSAADGQWFAVQCPGISVEPVIIDGVEYAVFADYAIAVADNDRDVYIYYSREIEEAAVIPDYADEKVDSPYWDYYCEIKAVNFNDKNVFYVSHKNDISDGCIYGRDCYDMTKLRDIILKCLEQRGELEDWFITEKEAKCLDSYFSCGLFRLMVYDIEGRYYVFIDGNRPLPKRGTISELAEIPESLYKELSEFTYQHYCYDRNNEPIFLDDEVKNIFEDVVRSDRWEEGSYFEGIDYFFYLDSRHFIYCARTGLLNEISSAPRHIQLTEEERQRVSSELSVISN